MQIQQTERVFRYSGGLVLPDPNPRLGTEAVRQVYASSYPEIITAAVTGPELVNGKQVFTFKTAVGTNPDHECHSHHRRPVEGFEFYRPFGTEMESIEWANQNAHLDETWCVGKFHPPEEE